MQRVTITIDDDLLQAVDDLVKRRSYDHHTRDLPNRLTHALHDRHDLSIASLHVHLDHESCLEVSVLRGAREEVHTLCDTLVSQRGVRHANQHLVPARISAATHKHGDTAATHEHVEV